MTKKHEGALSGYRVLDFTDSNGAYCAKLLADLGADVIKIERPEGDPGRRIPPFVDDVPHLEKSVFFLYRNANKRGLTLNLETSAGQDILKKLVKTADILIENFGPDYLTDLGFDYFAFREINPRLIVASMTEFGHRGPYKDRKGCNLVGFAMSGSMITSGFPGKPPCLMPGSPAYDAASMIIAISILTALYSRGVTGEGQYVETSVHQSTHTGIYPWTVPAFQQMMKMGGDVSMGREQRMGANIYPVFPCKDGFVRIVGLTPRQWDALVKVLGSPEVLLLPEWGDFQYRVGNADDLYVIIQEFTNKMTMLELLEAGRREGVPIAPILDIAAFYNSPHTKARKFFVEVEHPIVGKADYPGPPYRWTETPASVRRGAPCLGEHNEEVYCKELGYSTADLASLRGAGVL